VTGFDTCIFRSEFVFAYGEFVFALVFPDLSLYLLMEPLVFPDLSLCLIMEPPVFQILVCICLWSHLYFQI
jgi:hypothetical protein